MFCKKCGKEIKSGAKFCSICGVEVENATPVSSATDLAPPFAVTADPKPVVKCGNCGYVGVGESARKIVITVMAWLVVLVAPLITILYFVGTHKYRCPKCRSTFLGIQNKDGMFVGQRGGAGRVVYAIFLVLFGIAVMGILSSVILATLNSAREKSRETAALSVTEDWQKFNSVRDHFSVLFPAYPTFTTEQDIFADNPEDTYTANSYTATSSGAIFYVFKYIYSFELDVSDPDAALEKYLNAAVNADRENELVSSSYAYYSFYRVLDFKIKNNSEIIKGRFILVDQTPYLLMADYLLEDESSVNFTKFVNSFEA